MSYATELDNVIADNFNESFLTTLKNISNEDFNRLAMMKFNRLSISDKLDVIGEIMADSVGADILVRDITPSNCSLCVSVDLSFELGKYFIKMIEEDLEDAHVIHMHENDYQDAMKEHLIADLAQRIRDYHA